jgi:cysteine-rich repeat protein
LIACAGWALAFGAVGCAGVAEDADLTPPNTNVVVGGGAGTSGGADGGVDTARPGSPSGSPFGMRPPATCGDGAIQSGETCDDGNTAGGDGCASDCTGEAGFVCSTPGKACVRTIACGNNEIEGMETCDDGNTVDGDGCAAACTL